MIILKCPSCAATLTMDDSRAFRFCQYCGTKIHPVQGDGMQNDRQKLEAAKTLMELGEYERAKGKLRQLTVDYPQLGEAWLYLAKIEQTISTDQWNKTPNRSLLGRVMECTRFQQQSFANLMHQQIPKGITPEQARDLVIRYLTNTKEMVNARKLLGTDDPAYQKVFSEYVTAAQQDYQNTLRQIQVLQQNPNLLADMAGRLFSNDVADFCYKDQLIQEISGDDGSDYWKITVNGSSLEFELILCCGTMPVHRYRIEHILYADEQEVWTDRTHYTRNLQRSASAEQNYEDLYRIRRRKGLCMMCGAEKGLFGCKSKCMSKFK